MSIDKELLDFIKNVTIYLSYNDAEAALKERQARSTSNQVSKDTK